MTQFALYEMPKKECRRVAISVPIPKWLPPSLALWLRQRMAERPEGMTVATRFSKGERAAMKRRRPVPISAWAEKHRVLEMSAIRGRWRNVFTPYLTGIMDVSGLPGVETVIICKSPQTGGSECGHNIVGYCIDRLPGPVMYVFPDELTARENGYLNGAVLGHDRAYMDEHFKNIIDFAELWDFVDVPVKNYSSGMIARLGFSIATEVRADILACDEILSVGDFMFQQKCHDRMEQMLSGGTTLLFVSHDINQVKQLCKRAIWIDHGHLRGDGPSAEVCDAYVAAMQRGE